MLNLGDTVSLFFLMSLHACIGYQWFLISYYICLVCLESRYLGLVVLHNMDNNTNRGFYEQGGLPCPTATRGRP